MRVAMGVGIGKEPENRAARPAGAAMPAAPPSGPLARSGARTLCRHTRRPYITLTARLLRSGRCLDQDRPMMGNGYRRTFKHDDD
jgi:hypothetical protein